MLRANVKYHYVLNSLDSFTRGAIICAFCNQPTLILKFMVAQFLPPANERAVAIEN